MSTSGPFAGATYASDNVIGAVAWTSASNASVSDNAYATSVLLLGQISNYLKVTSFGFAVPSDATITGITLSVERSSNTLNGTHDDSVKLTVSGATVGSDKASATEWPTADAVATYGSATDLWGASWTPALINSSTFGAEVASTAGSNYAGYDSAATYDLTGSYATVQIAQAVNAVTGSQQYLKLTADASNNVQYVLENGTLKPQKTVATVQSDINAGVTFSATAHAYWRIRESGGTMYFDTSSDHINWTNQANLANPITITALTAELACGTYQSTVGPGAGWFDNFNTQGNVSNNYQFVRAGDGISVSEKIR